MKTLAGSFKQHLEQQHQKDVIHELQFPTSSLADTQPNAIDIIRVHQYHVMLGVGSKECSNTAAFKAYDGTPP